MVKSKSKIFNATSTFVIENINVPELIKSVL